MGFFPRGKSPARRAGLLRKYGFRSDNGSIEQDGIVPVCSKGNNTQKIATYSRIVKGQLGKRASIAAATAPHIGMVAIMPISSRFANFLSLPPESKRTAWPKFWLFEINFRFLPKRNLFFGPGVYPTNREVRNGSAATNDKRWLSDHFLGRDVFCVASLHRSPIGEASHPRHKRFGAA
jgi:hypothetical protein